MRPMSGPGRKSSRPIRSARHTWSSAATGLPTTPRRSTRRRPSWPVAPPRGGPASPARSVPWASASSRSARPHARRRSHTSSARRGGSSPGGAFARFQRQGRGLVAGGVDGFILETFSDVDEIHEALRAVRSVSDLPVIAQMTIGDDGLTHYGTSPETFAQQLPDSGADAVGVNCSVGPAGVLEAVEKLVKATDRPISAVPNAGLPKDVGDRKIYLASPEYMASYARRMIEAGARLVGGCCGTTPEHIKKIRDYVASVVARHEPVVRAREASIARRGGGT